MGILQANFGELEVKLLAVKFKELKHFDVLLENQADEVDTSMLELQYIIGEIHAHYEDCGFINEHCQCTESTRALIDEQVKENKDFKLHTKEFEINKKKWNDLYDKKEILKKEIGL